MKTKMFSVLSSLFSVVFLSVSEGSAQSAPQGFNYQAVARDASGNELVNTDMTVKIGILSGISADSLVWEEIHSVTTNDYGLFTLMIGDTEANNSGGTATSFSEIDWSSGDHFLKVEIDLNDGNGYIDMGASQLLSVPYALFAESGNEGPVGPQGGPRTAGGNRVCWSDRSNRTSGAFRTPGTGRYRTEQPWCLER